MVRSIRLAGLAAIGLSWVVSSAANAQKVQARITSTVDSTNRMAIHGSASPRARAENDAGKVPDGMKIEGMNIVFSRSETQEAALQTLIAAQQDPKSALYQKWLTPDAFAARFGMADADLAKVEGWLQGEGFAVAGVSRSRNRISFTGTAQQVEAAFGAPIHYFTSGGETHFAPSGDLSIPAALAGSIRGVSNVSNFRVKPRVKVSPAAVVKSNFTSSQSGNHFLTPKDIATIYDINAAYSAGYTGANQSIAVVGQTAILISDITNFQNASGLAVKTPNLILMPGTGTSAINPNGDGDEVESDLDVEYSGGIAKGATINFVYTGSNTNYGVFDALQYAVDERISPILTVSYGECETALGATDFATENAIFAQAIAQGQTILAASGDSGSTDCYEQTTLTTAQRQALAVDFPANSQYVTGLGGTEFTAASVAIGNTTYWATGTGDVVSSALSYIPEMVWNDDSSNGISAGGGGTSILVPRPSWQTGVTGIPSGNFRLVPDLSLAASSSNAAYLYCSSDSTYTGVTGSCANGFRDGTNVSLTVAGGTSFAAPVFAGMLAIINQAKNSIGMGLINSTLYSLASNSTTYASAFHDTTSGGNQCTATATSTTTYCNATGASAYAATAGYDQASGLGSVDFNNLLTAWPSTTATSLQASATTLSAATLPPTSGVSDAITITVAPASTTFTTTPTGTLTVVVDGVTVSSSLVLTSGVATYSFTSSTAGSHIITATYSGDATYAGSTSTLALSIGTPAASTGAFTVSAPALTVADGSSGSSTVTVTPAGGYTGVIKWTLSSSAGLTNACYVISNVTVPGTAPVTTALTIYTSSSLCSTAAVSGSSGLRKLGSSPIARNEPPVRSPSGSSQMTVALAGLLALGLLGRRSGRLRVSLMVALLGVVGFGLSGCGGSTSSTTTTTTTTTLATKGTYTLNLTGTDTTTSTLTASATVSLTIN